eukprot:3855533-Rhodomonas_salina.1
MSPGARRLRVSVAKVWMFRSSRVSGVGHAMRVDLHALHVQGCERALEQGVVVQGMRVGVTKALIDFRD